MTPVAPKVPEDLPIGSPRYQQLFGGSAARYTTPTLARIPATGMTWSTTPTVAATASRLCAAA